MKYPKLLSLVLLLTSLLFIQCKKKDQPENENIPVVKKDILKEKAKDSLTIYRPQRNVVLNSGVVLPQSDGEMELQLVGYLNELYKSAKEVRYFVFDGINFNPQTTVFTKQSDVQLQNVATILRQFPEAEVIIKTYDNHGGPAQEITKRQSLKVYEKLIAYGVPHTQLAAPDFSATSDNKDQYAGIVLGILPKKKK